MAQVLCIYITGTSMRDSLKMANFREKDSTSGHHSLVFITRENSRMESYTALEISRI
jgi:hypothetical protein